MIKKLNVGIIGLGVGKHHLNCVISNKYCNKIVVSDLNKKKLNQYKKKYPKIRTVSDADNLIKDKSLDLICIASYDNFHGRQILSSLKQNKFVFVEKPICLNQKEYKLIKRLLIKKSNLSISSNFILRHSPQFIKIKKLINKNYFGKIYHISGEYNFGRVEKITKGWRGKIPFYSVTHGGGIHIIDLANYLTSKKATRVIACGNKIATEKSKFKFNDMVSALVEFEDKSILNLTSNFGCMVPHHHNFKIFGTKATFCQEMDSAKIFKSRSNLKKGIKVNTNYLNKDKKYILENFIDSIVKKQKPIISQKDVMLSMAISLAIEKSIKSKKWEKVNY